MVERLDEERLALLRSWGTGLSSSPREELRAAGKAIIMLTEEIDRLQVDVWNARAAATQAAEPRTSQQSIATTLRDRLTQRSSPGET